MLGYIEYDNDKFVNGWTGMGPERLFHENDELSISIVNSGILLIVKIFYESNRWTEVNDKIR